MADVVERLRALQPDSIAELSRLREAVSGAVNAERLELCRLFLANRFGAQEAGTPLADVDPAKAAAIGDWDSSALFDAGDRAFLGFAEQFTVSVADVSDYETGALLEHASEQEVFDFAVALYVIEMEMRMSLVAEAVLAPAGGSR